MTKVVRKNSKQFKAAIESARDIRVFSLENYFHGKPVDAIPAWIANDFQLVTDGAKYTARVHSNLWYEFEAA